MIFVFDTNSFGVLKNFYPSVFSGFWIEFNRLVEAGVVASVREVAHELDVRQDSPHLLEWIDEHRDLFTDPTEAELLFVQQIFAVPHFTQLINEKQRLKATPVADPFVIARAYCAEGCVVTEEAHRPNAAKIPNVCEHFGIDCTNVEGFLARQQWGW